MGVGGGRKLTVMLCNFDKLFIEISLFASQLPIYTKANIPAMVAAFKRVLKMYN